MDECLPARTHILTPAAQSLLASITGCRLAARMHPRPFCFRVRPVDKHQHCSAHPHGGHPGTERKPADAQGRQRGPVWGGLLLVCPPDALEGLPHPGSPSPVQAGGALATPVSARGPGGPATPPRGPTPHTLLVCLLLTRGPEERGCRPSGLNLPPSPAPRRWKEAASGRLGP